ncbi:hypothetical protein [Streptomyces zhihengii]|uniref:Uncharacterized protein n=1 Tax=Streptomyces zhihengii TaxID=1818004 RepID=A0ABS2V4I7_9ACTN|nr:hypothetical protein [Streptomyces zhihengii]MBM9624740.1 hypothetical protein [Streptomyces zhihengii]
MDSVTTEVSSEFTQVQLTGPADAVARLMEHLSGVGEVIFGPVSQPAAGGNVLCTAQLVTRPPAVSPAGPVSGQRAVVTVQSVLELDPVALEAEDAAEGVASSVAEAAGRLPGVRAASARLVAVGGLPGVRE